MLHCLPLAPVSFTSRMTQSLYLSLGAAASHSRPLRGETSPCPSGRKVSLRVNGLVRVRTSVPESTAVRVTPTEPAGACWRLTLTDLESVRVSLTRAVSVTRYSCTCGLSNVTSFSCEAVPIVDDQQRPGVAPVPQAQRRVLRLGRDLVGRRGVAAGRDRLGSQAHHLRLLGRGRLLDVQRHRPLRLLVQQIFQTHFDAVVARPLELVDDGGRCRRSRGPVRCRRRSPTSR